MKTDTQLQRDVLDELSWAPDVEHGHIGVTAREGTVTLTGHVPNYAMKLAAERATWRVRGVKAVAQEIEVRLAGEPKASDEELAQRIVRVFSWNVSIPHDKVHVKVEKGLVTLSGEVEWNYQEDAARRAASQVTGIVGVISRISVRQRPTAHDVREKIIAALKRSAEIDANAIDVRVDGQTVKLGGAVHGWNERRVAEKAAWAAPGVLSVEDNIVLA